MRIWNIFKKKNEYPLPSIYKKGDSVVLNVDCRILKGYLTKGLFLTIDTINYDGLCNHKFIEIPDRFSDKYITSTTKYYAELDKYRRSKLDKIVNRIKNENLEHI